MLVGHSAMQFYALFLAVAAFSTVLQYSRQLAVLKLLVVAHVYSPVPGQRHMLNIGRPAHFLLK